MTEKQFESSFNKVAQIYDDARPAYPTQLFEDIKMVCQPQKLSDILEIGTGTGLATRQLLNFNLPITTIEPGENLLNIAKRNLSNAPDITYIPSTFEEFEATNKYDMLFSATTFHWLDRETKYQKANDLLRDNGFLILVWNTFLRDDSPVYHEIDSVYSKYLNMVDSNTDVNIKSLDTVLKREVEITESGLFYIWFSRRYITNYVYTAEKYAGLLNTFPEIIGLEEGKRNLFLNEIKEIIDKYKTVTVPVMSSLYVCRKKEKVHLLFKATQWRNHA